MTPDQEREPVGEPRSVRHEPLGRLPLGSRFAAASAIVVLVLTLVVLGIVTAENLLYAVGLLLAGALAVSALWIGATNRRFRPLATPVSALLLGAEVTILVLQGRSALAGALGLLGIGAAWALGTLALRWEVHEAVSARWQQAPATRHGVVFLNPRSGDGKVTKMNLVSEARRRGVEPVLLESGDDLRLLAEAAVARGADALGMAGGDGSQAVVAAVAADRGLPFVCVPAGTRNHFALDLGIDRDDPVGALDAFGPARETTIDLGDVNGEAFVNNVSLGLYAQIVASDQYRGAKRRTVAEMLPDLLGPEVRPSELETDGSLGPITNAQVILVSNNPYRLTSLSGFGSRPALDTGVLGVATLSINRPTDVNRLVALEVAGHPERYEGWRQWATRELEVRGPASLSAAVDGEARTWASPIHFTIRTGSLRVRIAPGQIGASPAFLWAPLKSSTLVGLWRIVRGRPSGIVANVRSKEQW